MILSDKDIKKEIVESRIVINPYDPGLINPSSIDFRLGSTISKVKLSPGFQYIDPKDPNSFRTVVVSVDRDYIMAPGEFVIGHALESLTIPEDIAVIVKGKSSLGRLGISNSHQAGLVDPGWSGVLTLEIANYLDVGVKLRVGEKIGQFVFYYTDSPAEKPYNKTGRYMNQSPGQGSKGV